MLNHFASSLGPVCSLDAQEDTLTRESTAVTCPTCQKLLELHSLCVLGGAKDVVLVCHSKWVQRVMWRFTSALCSGCVDVWAVVSIADVRTRCEQHLQARKLAYVVVATADANPRAVARACAPACALALVQLPITLKSWNDWRSWVTADPSQR